MVPRGNPDRKARRQAGATVDDSRPTVSSPSAPRGKERRGFLRDLLSRFFFFHLLVLKVTLLTALVFALTGAAGFFIVRNRVQRQEEVVPSLGGYRVEKAMMLLHESGVDLSLKLEKAEHSDMAEEDEIIAQYPAPGKRVKAGSVIRVRISLGSPTVYCPDVRGKDYLEAGIDIRNADLVEGNKSYVVHDTLKRDIVVAQDPPPDSPLPHQGAVNLLISLGPELRRILMPDLTNLTPAEAASELAPLGLKVAQVEDAPRAGIDNGLIFQQEPLPGAPVSEAETIGVTVVNNIGVVD